MTHLPPLVRREPWFSKQLQFCGELHLLLIEGLRYKLTLNNPRVGRVDAAAGYCILIMKGSVILLFPLLTVAERLSRITVQTSSGSIVGHRASNRSQVLEYLGIPYAQPPIGSLRFAAPQSYTANCAFVASKFVSRSDHIALL